MKRAGVPMLMTGVASLLASLTVTYIAIWGGDWRWLATAMITLPVGIVLTGLGAIALDSTS